MNIVIVILAVLIIALYWGVYTGDVPSFYRMRKCTGKKWKTAFPDESNNDIRKFLSVFCNAFAFSKSKKLRFEPDDKILDIYNALYSRGWGIDSLELETLADDIKEYYKVSFSDIWHENMSLGELYSKVVKNA